MTQQKIKAIVFAVLMVMSVFAMSGSVAGQQTPTVSVSDSTTDAGQSTSTDVTVDTLPNGLQTANITVSFANGSVADIQGASGGAISGNSFQIVSQTSDSITFRAADIGGSVQPGASNVNLATISLDNTVAGSTSLDVTVNTMEDDSGNAINPATDAGQLTVTAGGTQPPATDARPNPTNPPTKNVDSGATIYQGEEVTAVGALADDEQLVGVAGNAEDELLELNVPIPQDQTPGTYAVNGNSNNDNVRVTSPRIIDNEVRLGPGGPDVAGDAISTENADNLQIWAQYNFDNAETVEVTVEDESGTDITDAVLEDSIIDSSEAEAGALDLSDEDPGEYTIILEGEDDLDFGDATSEMTITTSSAEGLSLSLAEDSVTQGDNVEYTVNGGTADQLHVVTIDDSNFREGVTSEQAARIFRNVAEVDSSGVFDSSTGQAVSRNNAGTVAEDDIAYAYAVVEIDGTSASGSIETQHLSDTSVDVEVWEDSVPAETSAMTSADDASLSVEEGEVSLDSPTGSYVVGSQVDVNGTATSSDEVAVYIRDQTDWEVLDLDSSTGDGVDASVSVDSDDSFEEEDVLISRGDGGGNDILSLTGTYRIGIIDADDADTNGDGDADAELTTSEFNGGTSSSQSIRVSEGELSGNFVTINGQIAEEDGDLDVTGTAAGQDQVVVAFVDERGNTQAQTISVDDDDTFEEEDVAVSGLSQGTVSAHIISMGRDNAFGDGDLPGNYNADSHNDLVDWIDNLEDQSLSGEQVRDRLSSETTEGTASDDRMVSSNFRLSDATTTIDSVYPSTAESSGINPVAVNETMVVAGQTNRQPDDNVITVEVLDQNGDSVQLEDTETWENDGQWMVEIDTSDLDTGTYVVESDDGDSTDRAEVELVEERETTEPTETAEPPETTEPTETAEPPETAEPTEPETAAPTTTEGGTPGFGVIVAMIALIAAGLLAGRRKD